MILLCQTCGWRINERYNIYKIENNERKINRIRKKNNI